MPRSPQRTLPRRRRNGDKVDVKAHDFSLQSREEAKERRCAASTTLDPYSNKPTTPSPETT